jgi:CHASE2 domain-containing sensor protein
MIPLSFPTVGGKPVGSLAYAVVSAYNSESLASLKEGDGSLAYGSFLPARSFHPLSAAEVLAAPDKVRRAVEHKIVIVGGNWHSKALGRGGWIDEHATPAGLMAGAFVHANYVEALLDQRFYRPLEGLGEILEFALIVILILAVAGNRSPRLVLLLVAGLCLSAVVVSYLAMQNLGGFFDFSLPVIGLLCHYSFERVTAWRKAYRKEVEK